MKIAKKVDITKLLPSELLRLAVADVRKCLRSPRYRVDMTDWHSPAPDGVCEVCIAGAVMAQELDGKPDEALMPDFFGKIVGRRLSGLNKLREGDVIWGLIDMGVKISRAVLVADSLREERGFDEFLNRTDRSLGFCEGDSALGFLLMAMTWLSRQLKKRGL